MDVTLVQECLHSRTKSSNFYLTAFSYINKTLIYSLIICANVVFYNPLHGAPKNKMLFFLFHCACAFKPKTMIDLAKEIV